jgi:hypothetical protein
MWIIQTFVPYYTAVAVLLFYNKVWMIKGILCGCFCETKNYMFTSCQTYESSVPMEFMLRSYRAPTANTLDLLIHNACQMVTFLCNFKVWMQTHKLTCLSI